MQYIDLSCTELYVKIKIKREDGKEFKKNKRSWDYS